MTDPVPTLILYTKLGCHLCEELKVDLAALQAGLGFQLEERDIEANAVSYAAFRYLVPVLETPDGSLLYPPHDLVAIRRMLAAVGRADA